MGALEQAGLAGVLGFAAGVVAWWRLRTGNYRREDDIVRQALSRSWVVVVLTTMGATVAGTGAGWLVVPAWVYLVGAAVVVWIDFDVQRVPDRVVVVWAPCLVGAVGVAAVGEQDWAVLGDAGLGAAVLGALFLVLAVLGSMGFGDVKLAAVTGLALGPLGYAAVTTGVVVGFLAAGAAGVVLLLRGVSRETHVAFGPAIVAGAAAAVLRYGLGG